MVTPNFLYKYQSLSAHSLAALTNNTIWLAKPTSFNDPFDCAITWPTTKQPLRGKWGRIFNFDN